MSNTTIRVDAPSRLHFGLLSFNQPGEREFGGLGVMINNPGVRVSITADDAFCVTGPYAERARVFAERFSSATGTSLPNCKIQVEKCPEEHTGLGVGTQLGMAVGSGLETFLGQKPREAAELGAIVGRGKRSAIGTHGARLGGLLYERGKKRGEAVARLHERVQTPSEWRFVLLTLKDEARGLSGVREKMAFNRLPPVPKQNSETLRRLANQMRSAARCWRHSRFSELLYHYGYQAGLCFKQAQGGPFASKRIENLVSTVRTMGIRGVAQSSWGPTVAAVFCIEWQAKRFMDEILKKVRCPDLDITLAAPNNTGAVITVE